MLRLYFMLDVHAGPASHTHQEVAGVIHQPAPGHQGNTDIEAIPATISEKTSSEHLSATVQTDPGHNHSHAHDHNGNLKGPDEQGYETDPRLIAAQLVGVAILEFGVVLHSVIIGLTLAVDEAFRTLFVVLIFHRKYFSALPLNSRPIRNVISASPIEMFEGLGLGSRLAFLTLSPRFSWVPYAASFFYSAMTPLGIAIGLGVRTTYNPGSTTASLVSGTLDALSAGVLLYTGLVELLAHEFLFNPQMRDASTIKVAYACSCMIVGAGIMALLGRWA
jgi:zinc transporter 1/2/3